MTQNNEAFEKWFGETYKDLQFNKAGMTAAWQAATEQSQKEIELLLNQQERLIADVDEKDARIAELEDYKNSVIDQFVTAHHSYDESISAYENISKLIAYHQDIALDPKVSSVAARWVTQIEGLQAREKELVEALQNLVEDISKTHGNYTYEQAWINADEALANVRGEVK